MTNAIPVERFLAALYQKTGTKPTRTTNGWQALCPAHDDHRPSLSISEGDDGRVLVQCHAGCTFEAICESVGLRAVDLMTDNPSTETRQAPARRQPHRQDNGKKRETNRKPDKTYDTAEAAIEALEGRHGPLTALWPYHDAYGQEDFVVVRWDTAGGKKFRVVSRRGDKWVLRGMPEPRPLYRLPDLLAGPNQVFVTEGEKAAEAARDIGLIATTSPHGNTSASKADWTPLAGRECWILPDNDKAGTEYAKDVAAILAGLTPPAVVRLVELPSLPDKGDLVDWVAARPNIDAAELRRQVETLADDADVIQPDRPTAGVERFQPFPTGALPVPIRGFVEAGAMAIGCDTSYLALPMLTALAAAIGNTRCIRLKQTWTPPAILWAAIVGESGTAKTPAFKLVMRPLRDRQQKALIRHNEAVHQHDSDLACHKKAFSNWESDKKTTDDPPARPESPQAERCLVSDTTVEALAPLLLANPRGLLLARDELAGWFGSFDRYGKGSTDASNWMSMFNGEPIVVDRKTGTPRTIHVPLASVSVCGGIQPGVLRRALGVEHRESGLAARLLLTCPPRKPKQWTEADIDPEAESEIARLFDRLFELQPTAGEDNDQRPVVVFLTPEAKSEWKEYYNSHAQEQVDLSGDLAAAWSKLEEYAARLALVVHFARWAARDVTLQSADVLDVASMLSGITLAKWFKGEAKRVYSLLSESPEAGEERQLVEWIERKGGSVTVREVQQGHRLYPTAQDAEAVLGRLFKAGHGIWVDAPTTARGGRPSRVFHLSTASTSTKLRKPAEPSGFVDVDSVDAPETVSPADDWGQL